MPSRQHVAPDTAGAVGPVAGEEARPHPGAGLLVVLARLLGGRVSQAWKPERETPSASHIHRTGQIPRCFATKANFIALPSRSRPRPFLGCRAPP